MPRVTKVKCLSLVLSPGPSQWLGRALKAESKEELKDLLMKVKEEKKKPGLKLNIQNTKIMASRLTALWQIDGETLETVTDYFLGLQYHC